MAMKLEKLRPTGGLEAINLFSSSERRTALPFSLTTTLALPTSCIAANIYQPGFAGIFLAFSKAGRAFSPAETETPGTIQSHLMINYSWLPGSCQRKLSDVTWEECAEVIAENIFYYTDGPELGAVGEISETEEDPPLMAPTVTASDVLFSGTDSIKNMPGSFFLANRSNDRQTLLIYQAAIDTESGSLSDLSIEGIFCL